MAAKHRAPRTASRPTGPRAPGRRRRPALWRRSLTFVATPFTAWSGRRSRERELRELRLTVVALRAEVARMRELVAAETARSSLVLPLVRIALADGTAQPPKVREPIALDLGPDTARTEIVLPEAALLDPRVDRTPDPADEGVPAPVPERDKDRKIA